MYVQDTTGLRGRWCDPRFVSQAKTLKSESDLRAQRHTDAPQREASALSTAQLRGHCIASHRFRLYDVEHSSTLRWVFGDILEPRPTRRGHKPGKLVKKLAFIVDDVASQETGRLSNISVGSQVVDVSTLT